MSDIDTYSYLYESLDGYKHHWKIISQKCFENIGENFLIFNMNLDSFTSLENELTKNIQAFYKELLNTWRGEGR